MPPKHHPQVGRNLVNQRNNSNASNSGKSLPALIKCYVCKRDKPRDSYANAQIKRFQDTLHNPYAPSGRCTKDPKTTCKACTPGQTLQLFCIVCHKTMGLQKFSKNQRDKPEHARCIKCVEMHLGDEPGLTPPSSDYYDSDDSGDFDGMRIVGVRGSEPPDVREQPAPKALTAGNSFSNAVSKDKVVDDDGWAEVEVAGIAAKPQEGVHSFSQIENFTGLDSTIPATTVTRSDRGPGPKNVRMPDPVSNPPRREGDPEPRFRQNRKNKWGAPAAPEVPNEWANYSRTMNERRAGGFQQAAKQKKNSYNDDDDDDDDDDDENGGW